MKKLMTLLLAGMMFLGMVTVAKATTTISYISNATFSSFGKSDTAVATVGQTFRLSAENVGDDNLLDSVTFWIRVSTGDIKFKFYLYEWDRANSRITGGPLFESGELSTGQQPGNPEFTVDVGGVELNVDQVYVFFVSASDFLDGSIREGYVDAVMYQYDAFLCSLLGLFCDQDPTPDHTLVCNNNGADFSLLSSTAWSENTSFDMAFTMVLSASGPGPEPEPAAAFELGKAKVDLKKGKINVDGQVTLPEGVTCEQLDPVGSLKLNLFKLDESVERVVDDWVELEVKGRKGEKWEYKNRHALGVTEYKVHWKDAQTGRVKITADFDPGQVDLSQLTPKLVAEFTLGDLEFELTIAENGQYDCKLKKNKWHFRNRP